MRRPGGRTLTGPLLACLLLALPATRAAEEGPGRDRLEAEVKVTVGIAYLNNDQPAEALQRFEEALTLDPNNGTAHLMAAAALSRQQRYRDALPHLEQARALGAQAPPGRIDWFEGEANYWLGENATAAAKFQEALKKDPQDAFAHFYLGLCQMNLGQGKEAVASLDRAVALNPALGGSSAYYSGKAYYAQGDVEKARAEFESALKASDASANLQKASTNYLAASQKAAPVKAPRGELRAGFAVETDSNVVLEPTNPVVITDESANRVTLNLRGGYYPFLDRSGWTMGLLLNAYQSLHESKELSAVDTLVVTSDQPAGTPETVVTEASDFDLTAPQGVVSFTWGKDPQGYLQGPITYSRVPTGESKWLVSMQYGFSYYYLAGEGYLRTHEVGASVKIPETGWTSTQVDLDYRDNEFFQQQARTGTFFQGRVIQNFYLGGRGRTLRLGLRAGTTDADQIEPGGAPLSTTDIAIFATEYGGISSDYDSSEREIFSDFSVALPHRVALYVQAAYILRDYDSLNSNPLLNDSTPGETVIEDGDVKREDDQLLLSGSVVWGFARHWSLVGRYTYYRADSNKYLYEYDRGVGSLGVNWTF